MSYRARREEMSVSQAFGSVMWECAMAREGDAARVRRIETDPSAYDQARILGTVESFSVVRSAARRAARAAEREASERADDAEAALRLSVARLKRGGAR